MGEKKILAHISSIYVPVQGVKYFSTELLDTVRTRG